MVGAVITYEDKIIGEGWHQKYGAAHAEINAISAVHDKELLKKATLYVNLEPCSHYGKTPPCADEIIKWEIPKVVIGTSDPNSKVNGRGISKLKEAGIMVIQNILPDECKELNKRFFTFHGKKRPYIILKWAQTLDGYMDVERINPEEKIDYWITNPELRVLVHKWRSEEDAILIGYNTLLRDQPQLNTRFYSGKSPIPVVVERNQVTINENSYQYSSIEEKIENILKYLYAQDISSVIVEGGRKTLDMFLNSGYWDEARVLIGNIHWKKGLPAPIIESIPEHSYTINGDQVQIYTHQTNN
jgi:diaminohydroxyphosphoribosylaminopyrimidine deaminase/5-amino-6-(5-phosphoribosylamino)uracil reductase